ncbi:SOS response-associated peptidase [Actinopolyspora mortivallis]|uniref:Abasic site processing protein n=1 Tax=Actinopolyspora mortivallis TaxID=33906 RepID=A0A2T0GW06_ACTMO|nr:SOS response-associated peptidase [Actinopolyspora mortivallis]PRW63277.1 DUF159 family protein [Actinopolyspora mortivallis]
MCGRYVLSKTAEELATEFGARDATGEKAPGPDYNIAPTKPVCAVVQRYPKDEEGNVTSEFSERSVRVMRWGLVPKWAKDPSVGNRMINARSETVSTKPAFRGAVRHYRCLLPADGWYEWKGTGSPKQPYFAGAGDGSSLGMAGIWATWRDPSDPGGTPLVSCAVLTTDAVGELAEIHERMPLVLPRDLWERWLDPDTENVEELLAPPDPGFVAGFTLRPVSRAVNNVSNNGPELTESVPETENTLFES